MTLIEGVGDEVTLLFGLGVIVFIIILAWISTNIQEIPFFSVIIVELTQRRRQRANVGAGNEAFTSLVNNAPPDSTNTPSSSEDSDHTDELQSGENSSRDVPSSSDISGQNSNITEDAEVETTVRFVNVLDNGGSAAPEAVLHDIQGGRSREVQDEIENVIDTQTPQNVEGLERNVDTSPSQIIPDNQEDNLTETELRRRRVAFFDHKRNNNGHDVSEIRGDNSSHTPASGGDPFVPNSSSDHVSTVCDKTSVTSCDNEPTLSQDPSPPVAQTDNQPQESLLNQSEEPYQPDARLGEEVSEGDGRIRIRLKYLNDTQRNVVASPTDTVGQFRRVNFATELEDNKVVRFIFNGRDLRSDTMTLDSYNVVDNSVLHCLITQMNRDTSPPRIDTEGGFDMGTIMLPLFGVILCIMWYLRFEYRPFFSATSTISLFGITSLYVAAVLASWESHRRGNVHDHID
ncbi:transmembrane and ubiquitin-like domain-containing protein 1 [Ylistrum balloti]|uniref:transmembrane and ubiquitin-like domain-containing protein 1 n=1 Tax=Ylistrum balloti TaxID=509963 RepID=UPI002905BD8A|nr:transmembrane and ubiquitin-like domain-containing protein 1 [Ylistrum balloti]